MSKLKAGDAVRWELKRWRKHKPNSGVGKVVRIFPALGNMPVNYSVDTYLSGILYADEVKKVQA